MGILATVAKLEFSTFFEGWVVLGTRQEDFKGLSN